MEWGNDKSNENFTLVKEYLHKNVFLCINDGQPTRRLSDSATDLFIVSPRVVPEKQCVKVCRMKQLHQITPWWNDKYLHPKWSLIRRRKIPEDVVLQQTFRNSKLQRIYWIHKSYVIR